MFLHRDSDSLRFHQRTWLEYVDGFADKSGSRLWVGLENAHRLTVDESTRLYVTMTGPDGYTGTIEYPGFRLYGKGYKYAVTHQPYRRGKQTGWRINNTGQNVKRPTIVQGRVHSTKVAVCACYITVISLPNNCIQTMHLI